MPSRCGSSSQTAVIVQIRRRGGLAGVTLRADFDTAELGSQTAGRVEDAVGRLLKGPRTASTPRPDAFEYEITVPGHGAPVVVGEHDLPSDLEPLIERLPKVGQVENRLR